MGYSTTINWRTGREVFVCDFCGKGDGTGKKVYCPFNWCPPPIACEACRKAKKHLHNAEQKASCKQNAAVFAKRRALEASQPHNVVSAAWGSWATGIDGVVLVITADRKYYLVKGYEVRSPNWLDANEIVGQIADEQAKALLDKAYATA